MDSIHVPKTFLNWEVRANRDYLFAQEGNRWFKVPMSALAHCAVSLGIDYRFRVTAQSKEFREFTVSKKGNYAQDLFCFLQSFPFGFNQVVSTYTPRTWKYSFNLYRIDRTEFAADTEKFFGKAMKPLFRIPVREIVAVTQYHQYDAEGADLFHLRVHTADGKFRNIECDSIQHAYEVALMIKDNAPHVRYGLMTRTGIIY